MADSFNSLSSQNVVRTPDGRYFLPFDTTLLMQGGQPKLSPDDPNYGKFLNPNENLEGQPVYYDSLQELFNKFDPSQAGWGTTQDTLGINTTGMSSGQIAAMKGNYNGRLGYYFNPNQLVGAHPANVGAKPNDGGLWQMLSLIAPAAGGILDFAGSGLATGGAATGDVALSGSEGTATLSGGAGSDTLSTASSTGGNMGYFDDFTGQWVDAGGDTGLFGSNVDEFGNPVSSNFSGGNTNDFFNPATSNTDYLALAQKYGPQIAKLIIGSGNGGGAGSRGLLGGLFGNSGASLGSTIPGMLALAYAGRQPGIDTSRLSGVFDAAGANAPLFTQAAIDPVQKNIAAGYGDLLQSQGLRGIRGSSFGNTDIANYLDITGRTLGDVGANAAQKALGLQGNLAGNIAELQAKSQEMKNNLYGRAFDVLGRGLNPRGYGGLTLNP